jgi:hypothetical protein
LISLLARGNLQINTRLEALAMVDPQLKGGKGKIRDKILDVLTSVSSPTLGFDRAALASQQLSPRSMRLFNLDKAGLTKALGKSWGELEM